MNWADLEDPEKASEVIRFRHAAFLKRITKEMSPILETNTNAMPQREKPDKRNESSISDIRQTVKQLGIPKTTDGPSQEITKAKNPSMTSSKDLAQPLNLDCIGISLDPMDNVLGKHINKQEKRPSLKIRGVRKQPDSEQMRLEFCFILFASHSIS
jgi:hypothetical protein